MLNEPTRRGFLAGILGGSAGLLLAPPIKTYSFLGNIFRKPRVLCGWKTRGGPWGGEAWAKIGDVWQQLSFTTTYAEWEPKLAKMRKLASVPGKVSFHVEGDPTMLGERGGSKLGWDETHVYTWSEDDFRNLG